MVLQHALQAFLIAGVVSPFSYYAGLTARRLRLPQITGYLVSGIICGPYCLGILSAESVADLSIIEGACLGIIGLAAGAELQLSELNRSKKQVVSLTAGICVLTWLLCYFTISWSASLTPVLHVTPGQLAAIASLGATIMMARSPASAIAVLKEMDARGPFVSLVMGVVVLKDVAVIVAFALNMELVPTIIDHNTAGLGLSHLLLPLLSVCVSLSAGLLGGSLVSLALHHQLQHRLLSWLVVVVRATHLLEGHSHAALAHRCKQAVVLLLSTAVFSVTRSLEAEPLLACVTAGMLLANKRPSAGGAGGFSSSSSAASLTQPASSSSAVELMSHDELSSLINSVMTLTNVAFFGLAGASLKLSAIVDSLGVALVVFVVRLAAIAAGSRLGCQLGGVKPELQRRCFWMSMVTQAGVAMGLARIAGTAFASEWGPAFQTVMMAIIMLNMLAGPPLFRAALIQVGEARAVLHTLPLGQQPQHLHRDSSVGGPHTTLTTALDVDGLMHHHHQQQHLQLASMEGLGGGGNGGGGAGSGGGAAGAGAHNSNHNSSSSSSSKPLVSRISNSNGSDKAAAAGDDRGGSSPPRARQRHGEQQLRSLLHVPQQQQQHTHAPAAERGSSSRAGKAAGLLVDPGGGVSAAAAGDAQGVVMSSGVLLHHLGGGGGGSSSSTAAHHQRSSAG